jgi:small subunit ribosomal protein S17
MTGETQAAVPEVMRRRRTTMGVVISDKMDKTVVVAVERRVSHPRYDRVIKRTSKFHAHDETNSCKVGDVVTLVETRPLSRLKRWRVRSVLREGKAVERIAVEAAVVEDTGRPKPKRQKPVAQAPGRKGAKTAEVKSR